MNKLKALSLLLCAVLCMSCENPFLKCLLPENAPEVSAPAPAPVGKAVLTLSPYMLNIRVMVTTADGSSVTVKGCTEATLASGTETVLHAQGTRVTLKGKITELRCRKNKLTALDVQGLPLQTLYCGGNQLTSLDVQGLSDLRYLSCGHNQLTSLNVQGLPLQRLYCRDNQLTSLNVRGCSALQWLYCYKNKLDAADFISIFDALPDYSGQHDGAHCTVYSTEPGEGNCTNFNSPPELQTAFNGAKTKNWKMYKKGGTWWQEI